MVAPRLAGLLVAGRHKSNCSIIDKATKNQYWPAACILLLVGVPIYLVGAGLLSLAGGCHHNTLGLPKQKTILTKITYLVICIRLVGSFSLGWYQPH